MFKDLLYFIFDVVIKGIQVFFRKKGVTCSPPLLATDYNYSAVILLSVPSNDAFTTLANENNHRLSS